ncbi:hypothetical protein Agabi119p4_2549 [Agaricus bisporus var. burnettii]|uniref:Uncharacterized protein n=1 Tax=Agaricus bisporus var. burnettii TaxID=192524 RepID=A0A8H7F9D9_AGABI|nr:hypothetical protein Agabi119p4_2549 [Agaricus bisporus var. burnettii]
MHDDRKRRKKEKSRRKESKERRKERKKEKRDKKKKSSSTSHWGKYGIITEIDVFTKRSEFHAWLVEERKLNPETLSKDQERKAFAHFIEDFNTATLPHEKFYNTEKYERRMDALRQGEFLPPAEDVYDPEADMRVITGAHKKKAPERESYMSREQLEELRKVQNERVQVSKMKLLGMDVKQTMGVRMDGTAFDDL